MANAFGRQYELRLATPQGGIVTDPLNTAADILVIRDLHIEFGVSMAAESDQSRASITIYNLSPSSYKICAEKQLSLGLWVGYEGAPLALLFSGDVITSSTQKQGTEVITELEVATAQRAIYTPLAPKSYPLNTPAADVAKDIFTRMGLVEGVVDLPDRIMTRPYVLSGMPIPALTELLTRNGYDWSISNGRYNINRRQVDTPRSNSWVVSEDTGMLESPRIKRDSSKQLSTDTRSAFGLQVKTTLNPSVQPGDRVKVKSRFLSESEQGVLYRVAEVRHTGSYEGQEWTTELDLKDPSDTTPEVPDVLSE